LQEGEPEQRALLTESEEEDNENDFTVNMKQDDLKDAKK
jgi:hypothetical protein